MLLVKQFQDGNEKAFKKLFELFWEPMFLNAMSVVMDRPSAEDIVQNVWTAIWNKRTSIQINNFEGYLYKAVRYSCYRYLKRNKLNTVQLEIIESIKLRVSPEVDKKFDFEETQITIQKSLKNLSPRCREIFKLSRIEEIKNEEIASLLGISKRSVENQISIALKSISHTTPVIAFLFKLSFLLFL